MKNKVVTRKFINLITYKAEGNKYINKSDLIRSAKWYLLQALHRHLYLDEANNVKVPLYFPANLAF